jgi:hypothetical protein
MAKRRAENQIVSLTLDQKKSGTNLIYLASDNVPYTIGKLLTKATTLLKTAPQSKVCLQSYGVPKSRESSLT